MAAIHKSNRIYSFLCWKRNRT